MLPLKGQGSGRLLSNTAWNVAGQVVPLLVGIAVLPLLIRTIGIERFGFLTLVWVLVGYAGVFDLGIGNVLVRLVAARLARGDVTGAHHLGRVGLSYLALFGVAIGSAFALGGTWLVTHFFKLPPELLGEASLAMWLLASSVPLVMLTTGFAGVISAHQRFRDLNMMRAAIGVASYVGPLTVALWVPRLDALVAVTILLRAVGAVGHALLARHSCGFALIPTMPDAPTSREILSIGGWMGISNVVGPMLTYLDRLLLGALVPVRMVAFYATPYDVISRTLLLPWSAMSALLPRAAQAQPGSPAARQMLGDAARLMYLLMLPVSFSFVVLARPALQLWLGDEFAQQSTLVMQLLAIGVFINALAQSAAVLIQGAGQPRSLALMHLAQLPLYGALLYTLTLYLGIVGTALAALARFTADALMCLVIARRGVARGPMTYGPAVLPAVLAAALLLVGLFPWTGLQAFAAWLGGLGLLGLFAWRRLLTVAERDRVRSLLWASA